MKKISYLLSIAMMAAAGLFCACSSSDDDVAEATADETSTGNQYMAVTLTFANGSTTRTDYGYEEYDATEAEQAVDASSSYFLFYNSSGTCIATGTLASSASWPDEDSDGIDAYTENLVTVSMESGYEASAISQVVAVLNCPSDVTLSTLKSKSLTELSSTVVSGGLDGGSGDFIMSSAVLYSSSSLISGPAVDAKVYTTGSEAQASPTTIYVDRLAAKVTIGTQSSSTEESYVQAASGDASPYAILSSTYVIVDYNETNSKVVSYQKAKVKVVIDGWGITGTNSNAYLIKNITVSNSAFTTDDVLAKAYSNSALGSGWYNSNTYQLHWAEDVNYDSGDISYGTGTATEGSTYALSYAKYSGLEDCSTEASYYQENTVDYTGQSSTTYNVAGGTIITPALVLAAHLEIDYNSKNLDTYTSLDYDDYTGGTSANDDLYFLNGYFYTINGLKYEIIELLKAAGYTADASGTTLSYSSDATITISRISGTSLGYVSSVLGLTLYNKEGSVVTNVADAINTQLGYSSTSSTSDLKLYTAGKCYYAALIEHMNSTSSGITDSNNEHADETTNAVPIYGFVRNNHYDLTINKITGVGAAIDPDSEITTIPDEETYYYLDAKVNILAWRYASQSIDF